MLLKGINLLVVALCDESLVPGTLGIQLKPKTRSSSLHRSPSFSCHHTSSNSHNLTKSHISNHETALSTFLTEPHPRINILPPKSPHLSVKTSQLAGNNKDQKSTFTTKPRLKLAITSQQGV